MRGERTSRTAALVAFMRAVADAGATHVRDFHDPTARVFLNAKWLKRLQQIEAQHHGARKGMTYKAAVVSADVMALRTSTIDDAVRAAVAGGARQVVILGAGLDGRAWRMRELEGVRVFEVDHPATQAVKRAHLAELPPMIASVTFVPVNFERDSLGTALTQAGHDIRQRTCWIWEGVVMYLTHATMLETLRVVAARSVAGSTLIVNYHTSMRRGFVRLLLRLMGEPVKSKASPEEMAADLASTGFTVVEDTGVKEWAQRYSTNAVQQGPAHVMRIVVATRTS